MKQWIYGFVMCQSMFCALPCPWRLWDEKARGKMLLCLPMLGLELGLGWYGLGLLCRWLCLPVLLAAFCLAAYPYLITGFIHLDGFMDVVDAVRSYRSLERRREILKDSHVGSFAVIGLALLMLAQFAAFASVKPETKLGLLILIPAVSRCCSGLAVLSLKPMSTSQYADTHRKTGDIAFLVTVFLVLVALGFAFFGWRGIVTLLGTAGGYGLALRRAYRSLEGMNGDVSGYSQTLAELCGAVLLAII